MILLRGWLVASAVVLACDSRLAETPVATQSTAAVEPSARPESARRLALLIGINDYTASTLGPPRAKVPDRGWRNLSGAIHDVESMRDMLLTNRYGFDERDIIVLKDQEATRAAILSAIESHLEKQSRKGDVAFFFYSGHGSQVFNSASSDQDKLDESIVPADSRLGADDIRDKVLRRAFNRVLDRGARLTVMFDKCHSGSGVRGDGRERYIPKDTRDVADKTDPGPAIETRGALFIAAAHDREMARETEDPDDVMRGVFSWAWLRAMRRAEPGEAASDMFLRAQAFVRAESASQDPVIDGSPEAKASPFLSTEAGVPSASHVLAIEEVRADGSVIVHGGWAHGLTIGSELRLVSGRARFEVKQMLGLGRCIAQLITPATAPPELKKGEFLEIAGWASPPGRPLRVWMPQIASTEEMTEWVEGLARAARRKKVRWVDDPAEATPEFLLRWRDEAWELLDGNGVVSRFDTRVPQARVLERIRSKSSLFVQLPAPSWLVTGIAVGPGTAYTAVDPVPQPDNADYVLTGRFRNGDIEYAWVRPFASAQRLAPLPARTAWQSATKGAAIADRLQRNVLRLRTIHAWQFLESPPQMRSGFDLEIRGNGDNRPIPDGRLTGGEDYVFALRSRPGAKPTPRYIYVFMIDSHGRSALLYPTPEAGFGENHFPLASQPAPAEIALDSVFHPIEPYGADTYFLLTTDEPLPDPEILQWDGVRALPSTNRQPLTALEELITTTSSMRRSAARVRVPAKWSIDRMLVESVPPKPRGTS